MTARTTESELEKLAMEIGHFVKVEKLAPPGQRVASGEINAVTAVMRKRGVTRGSITRLVRRMLELGLDRHWKTDIERIPLKPAPAVPRRHGGKVFLATAAQDDTDIHLPFWENLLAYADFRSAEILVGGFTYQKGLFEDHSVAAGVFRPQLVPHLSPHRAELHPGLIWHGHRNVLPTATKPVSGWQTVDGLAWSVMPHAKIQLETIAVMPGQMPKQVMTTGAVTRPNYVDRAAGQKAEFHHTYGAVVVEIASDGAFWCRQINASHDGSFQDLFWQVRDGRVSAGHSIEGFNPGDLHADDPNVEVTRAALGMTAFDQEPVDGSILSLLRPSFTFLHDSFTFAARSHHVLKDPHELARLHWAGIRNVQEEVAMVSAYLGRLRDSTQSMLVHVASNHNMHLDTWLKNPSAHSDPENAGYWHALNARWHEAIREGASGRWLIHEEAMRAESPDRLERIRFLSEGESFQICQGINPIDCGLHAHVGPNGARGSLAGLSKVPVRKNLGHSHKPGITDGDYQAGTLGNLLPSFATKGPIAWVPADIITYPNAKRTIITHWHDGRWWIGA